MCPSSFCLFAKEIFPAAAGVDNRWYMKMKRLWLLAACLLLLTSCACAREAQWDDALTPLVRTDALIATNAPMPAASALLDDTSYARLAKEGITVEYAEKNMVPLPGQQTVLLLLRAPNGATKQVEAVYSGVFDTTPPTVDGVVDRSALCGEGVVLREGVRITDDCLGEVTLTVDASAVDNRKEGVYEVVYTATDAAGNTTTVRGDVYIYAMEVSEQMLNDRIDELLLRLDAPNKDRETLCRSIYACIQASLTYVSDGDQSDWVRAAYTSLFVSGQGDCFSYFSAAKALLQRAGIEYIEIQRTPGYTDDTHYWLLVNIAEDGEKARWYYLDPTELRHDEYDHSGCLLTLAQLQAYDRVRPCFYLHDTASLPPVCEEIITPTPELSLGESWHEN